MASVTPNLELKLPDKTDYFNIEDFNSNFTKIDTFLTRLGLSFDSMNEAMETALQGGELSSDNG